MRLFARVSYVKLNNPLMGTETINQHVLNHLRNNNQVKLNNPLMGTETNQRPIGIWT